MLVSGIFQQRRTFVFVPDVMSKFSKIENLFFFRGSVWCQHQLNYILLGVTDNFSFGKGAKTEIYGRLLRVASRLKSIHVMTVN